MSFRRIQQYDEYDETSSLETTSTESSSTESSSVIKKGHYLKK